MQEFLKKTKIVSELIKGVSSMRQYLYPSVLQKQSIPAMKKATDCLNFVIQYQEMNGIKLTVFLPLLDAMIRQAI